MNKLLLLAIVSTTVSLFPMTREPMSWRERQGGIEPSTMVREKQIVEMKGNFYTAADKRLLELNKQLAAVAGQLNAKYQSWFRNNVINAPRPTPPATIADLLAKRDTLRVLAREGAALAEEKQSNTKFQEIRREIEAFLYALQTEVDRMLIATQSSFAQTIQDRALNRAGDIEVMKGLYWAAADKQLLNLNQSLGEEAGSLYRNYTVWFLTRPGTITPEGNIAGARADLNARKSRVHQLYNEAVQLANTQKTSNNSFQNLCRDVVTDALFIEIEIDLLLSTLK